MPKERTERRLTDNQINEVLASVNAARTDANGLLVNSIIAVIEEAFYARESERVAHAYIRGLERALVQADEHVERQDDELEAYIAHALMQRTRYDEIMRLSDLSARDNERDDTGDVLRYRECDTCGARLRLREFYPKPMREKGERYNGERSSTCKACEIERKRVAERTHTRELSSSNPFAMPEILPERVSLKERVAQRKGDDL